MKQIDRYILEKLIINKKVTDETITDEEAIEDGIWEDVYYVIKKYLPDFDEWKYYIYFHLKTKGQKDTDKDTNLQINFVYSFPEELEKPGVEKELEEDILNIETKTGKQAFIKVKCDPKKQSIYFYFNQ